MIEPNKLYPKQMNGSVISAYGNSLNAELEDAYEIENYLHGLSIATANEKELENIGRLVGYPRPLVPEAFSEDANFLTFGTLPITTDEMIGLSRINSAIGGMLSTIAKNKAGYMSLGLYRQFLDKVAIIKRYGLTIYTVDKIAALVSDNYTITFDENHDVVLSFQEAIGFKYLWILTSLFYKVATEPFILITSED